MHRDHPLFGASATVLPIASEVLTRLKKKRHLQRLLAVCEGGRDPEDVGLRERPRGLDLTVAWGDLEAWLEQQVHRDGARWSPDLFDRYLRKISRKEGPAGYWTAHEAVFTMGEACRMVRDLLRELGVDAGDPPRSNPVPYQSRGRTEVAWGLLYPPTLMEILPKAIGGSRFDTPAGREALGLLGYMSACMASGVNGEPCAFLVLPRLVDEAPPENRLGPVRDPGGLVITDPANVVAYLRHRAVNQIHNTFSEYHAADQILERMRASDDGFSQAIDAACTRLMEHGQEPETIDMAYHLTSVRSSPAFFAAVLDRLEAGDLPPQGPPLHKDLPQEFLQRLNSPVVAATPALKARAERLLEAAGEHGALLGLALRCSNGRELANRMDAVAAEDLTAWTARCVADRVATDPDEYLVAVASLGRAAPETRGFFWKALAEQAPPWLEARREELAALLGDPA